MKKILLILLVLILVLSTSVVAFASDNDNGFGDNNKNITARLFNGFYTPDYPNLYLIMKWSKDWTPMAAEPVGAWVTNHFTWYSNDCDVASGYGFNAMTDFGTGTYKVEEFYKIMTVTDDPVQWAAYKAAGAYDAGWGLHGNGTPCYVVIQDNVTVFDATTGELVSSAKIVDGLVKGLGQPTF